MTNDTKLVTERAAVERERNAFTRGFLAHRSHPRDEKTAAELVCDIYPLPKVTRPRVVVDPLEWRIRWSVDEDGAISGESNDCGHWYGITLGHSAFLPIASRIAVWADLIARPTEEVDA